MTQDLLAQLQKWHEDDEFQKIIDTIYAIPEAEWDYELRMHLARALNNAGDMKGAIEQLRIVEEQGKEDPLWHFRMGYAYYYLDREEEAIPYFERAQQLDPKDQDAPMFLGLCREEMERKAGQAQVDFAPELYTDAEIEAVEAHIEQHFGHFSNVFHEIASPDIHVDIAIVEPTPERNYYTLVTMGMGAHCMNIPEELRDKKLDRAEMLICLPPDWEIQGQDERWYWPLRWLKILARLPGEEDSWLGWGHTVPNGGPFAENTYLSGVMLVSPGGFGEAASVCPLPDGDEINFYQVIPLYEQEMDFKIQNGAEALLDRMQNIQIGVVDLNRPNACGFESVKQFTHAAEEIKPLLERWEGPEGCIATDRILVDGCKVGYMYREEPDGDFPDSGWRFTAGDESEEYMANPDHSGVYALNTVCNYDPEIIPLLRAPYGTAYLRDQHGAFRQVEFDPEIE